MSVSQTNRFYTPQVFIPSPLSFTHAPPPRSVRGCSSIHAEGTREGTWDLPPVLEDSLPQSQRGLPQPVRQKHPLPGPAGAIASSVLLLLPSSPCLGSAASPPPPFPLLEATNTRRQCWRGLGDQRGPSVACLVGRPGELCKGATTTGLAYLCFVMGLT